MKKHPSSETLWCFLRRAKPASVGHFGNFTWGGGGLIITAIGVEVQLVFTGQEPGTVDILQYTGRVHTIKNRPTFCTTFQHPNRPFAFCYVGKKTCRFLLKTWADCRLHLNLDQEHNSCLYLNTKYLERSFKIRCIFPGSQLLC